MAGSVRKRGWTVGVELPITDTLSMFLCRPRTQTPDPAADARRR